MDLFPDQKSRVDLAQVSQIRAWIFAKLTLDSEVTVSISQLTCAEPDCPPIETVIAVMTQPPKRYKVHKAIAKINESDIAHALLNHD